MKITNCNVLFLSDQNTFVYDEHVHTKFHSSVDNYHSYAYQYRMCYLCMYMGTY